MAHKDVEQFNFKKETKAAVGIDAEAEAHFLHQFHQGDDERFGNDFLGDTALQLAFRAGMAWARRAK